MVCVPLEKKEGHLRLFKKPVYEVGCALNICVIYQHDVTWSV